MGYYMRYIVTDAKEINLNVLETALKHANPLYSIQRSKGESGELKFGDEVVGIVEVNSQGDELFGEELDELVEEAEEAETGAKQTVLDTLKTAKSIIAVQVLWGGRKTDETLASSTRSGTGYLSITRVSFKLMVRATTETEDSF